MPENRLKSLHLEATPQDFARLFKSPPEQAIEAWEKRIAMTRPSHGEQARAAQGIPQSHLPWKSTDVMWHGHSRGFFVARMTRSDVLADIHREVDRALREGRTFESFRRDLAPMLKAKGWWSGDEPDQKSLVRNPRTGQDEWARLGTPRRLRTIYQTNLSVSYHAGRYQAMDGVSDLLPYQQYHTLDHGKNRRPAHQLLDGKVFRSDDPALSSIRPPNGWGCQCRMAPLTERMARKLGELPGPSKVVSKTVQIDGRDVTIRGVATPGGNMFPDPQWAYDVSEHGKAVEALTWSRVSQLPESAQRSFVQSISKDPALMEQRSRYWNAWSRGVHESGRNAGDESVAVGWLDDAVWKKMADKTTHGRAAESPILFVDTASITHGLRASKDPKQRLSVTQLENLPHMLSLETTRWGWDGDLIAYAEIEGKENFIRMVFEVDRGRLRLDTATRVHHSALNSQGKQPLEWLR